MSNFRAIVLHPKTKQEVTATFFDDYFGKHKYGVKIDGDKTVYEEHDIEYVRSEVDVQKFDSMLQANWVKEHPQPDEVLTTVSGIPLAIIYFNPSIVDKEEWNLWRKVVVEKAHDAVRKFMKGTEKKIEVGTKVRFIHDPEQEYTIAKVIEGWSATGNTDTAVELEGMGGQFSITLFSIEDERATDNDKKITVKKVSLDTGEISQEEMTPEDLRKHNESGWGTPNSKYDL